MAILSLGDTRTLLLRPDGGGPSTAFALHAGDLLVQGGTCQRTFEHCVPKRAHAGPADQRDVPPAGWELTYRRPP